MSKNMTKVKADLHNHLKTSNIFKDKDFNRAIDAAYKRLGPGGIFEIVNFNDRRYEEFSNLKGYERVYIGESNNGFYVPEKDIIVVKGQEVPTQKGHLLVLGLGSNKHLKQHKLLKDTLKEAKDNNGIIIIDHPFYSEGIGKHPRQLNSYYLLKNTDGIEIYNGEAAFGLPLDPLPFNANKKALEFYKITKENFPNVGALSSSDGHSMYELGSNWTEIDKPKIERDNFVNSLRESVRKTDLNTNRKNKKLILGSIDHIVDLIFLTKIAPKFRLNLN